MVVEMAQIISNEQHEGLLGRTTNMKALNPFVDDDAFGRKTIPIPIARWKQEFDIGKKSKMYRKEFQTEIIMPVY
jgi:hypothetical protein